MNLTTLIQLVINGLAMGLLYALPALGISLIWNASGLFNFAQGDLLTFGAYIMLSLFSKVGLPYVVSFLLTFLIMGSIGYILSSIYFYPMFRARINPQIILIGTVALSVFIRNAILLIWGPQAQSYQNPFGSSAIQFGEVYVMPHIFGIFIIVALLLGVLQLFLRGTITGIGMRAVAQRPVASSLMGIKNNRMVALTFFMSTGIAAVSGILIAPILPLTPETGGMIAIKAFAAVLIGGLGSFSGALVGGIAVGITEMVFATLLAPTYKDVFIFIVLAIFLVLRPGGIFRAQISEKV